ncbi:hypothetical protein NPIL_617741 [Nephila pilipes]|uniref:Uncharacterized protein n=1 Tax=Nephila pilipes TaxID=299642 RepID=A0A8X6PIA0_NEPPI|nr:hypothetical protein NPIL_617741 [Nephila pilipes]
MLCVSKSIPVSAVLVMAITMAPAFFMREKSGESSAAFKSLKRTDPPVHFSPAVRFITSSIWSIGCGSIFVMELMVREKSTTSRFGVISWKGWSTMIAGAA